MGEPLVWVILVLGILALAIWSRAFRYIALVLGGICVLVIGGFFIYEHRRTVSIEQARQVALTRIPLSDVEILNTVLGVAGELSSYGSLEGRIRNLSDEYTLTAVTLRITIQDCNEDKVCDTVLERDKRLYLEVPPNQARDFDRSVNQSGIRIRGSVEWSYQLLSTEGE